MVPLNVSIAVCGKSKPLRVDEVDTHLTLSFGWDEDVDCMLVIYFSRNIHIEEHDL
jgi:hypothetical protein